MGERVRVVPEAVERTADEDAELAVELTRLKAENIEGLEFATDLCGDPQLQRTYRQLHRTIMAAFNEATALLAGCCDSAQRAAGAYTVSDAQSAAASDAISDAVSDAATPPGRGPHGKGVPSV